MNVLQNGEVILSLLVSFHVDKEGREFQDVEPPSVLPPEEIPEPELAGHNTMFDLRPIHGSGAPEVSGHQPSVLGAHALVRSPTTA